MAGDGLGWSGFEAVVPMRSTARDEDERGVLVTYLDLMSPHVRTKDAKRKASMQTSEDSHRQ